MTKTRPAVAAAVRRRARRRAVRLYNGQAMWEPAVSTIEQVLVETAPRGTFLTRAERLGGWRALFGDAAARMPEPYLLFTEDERDSRGPAWPLLASPAWERFSRELASLAAAEAAYRFAVAGGERPDKRGLLEHRTAVVQRVAGLLENAHLHDHEQCLPEILWLALSREIAELVRTSTRLAHSQARDLAATDTAQIRYALAEIHVDLVHKAETEALSALKRIEDFEPNPAAFALGRLMREDVLPFFLDAPTARLSELDPYLRARLGIEPPRFHNSLTAAVAWLDEMREANVPFARALSLVIPDAPQYPSAQLIVTPAVLDLLDAWEDAGAQKLPADVRVSIGALGTRLKRFELLAALRGRIISTSVRGNALIASWGSESVQLSASTRPLDFTAPGVIESTVRRYGLLYDLVEFTQILEELRRRGRAVEDRAMRLMTRFQQRVGDIRKHHRLRFEKFLGDGAFFSARRASPVLFAAAELRVLYEAMRAQGFPFDRGLRLAVNVGTYHLFPMTSDGVARPRFEFLGHGLVELARLTTGKTTQEVGDIEDFLIASGYDVHRVLEFLEPVRHASRFPEHARERSYAAFLAENQELVNLGGVATEAFMRELEGELSGAPLFEAERWGLRWILVPLPENGPAGFHVGLRLLGTARLKGLDPTPIVELVVFEPPIEQARSLPSGPTLLELLQRRAGGGLQPAAAEAAPDTSLDPHLCVVSAIEPPDSRMWYMGLFHEDVDALFHAFRVPLNPVDVKDGEPFESWLFRQRLELSRLYRGLRRDGQGATLSLAELRDHEGYFACLLQAPHRSPR